jgi:hypothetical protein
MNSVRSSSAKSLRLRGVIPSVARSAANLASRSTSVPYMNPSLRAALAIVFMLLLALGAGCSSSDEAGPASSITYDLFPTTHILSAEDTATLTSAADDGTLTFAAPSPAVASLAVGDVLVTGISEATPKGLLRVVLGAHHGDGGALVLTTAAAPLQLAFRRLHARSVGTLDATPDGAPFTKTDLSPLGGTLRPQWTVASGAIDKSQHYQVIVFDGDGNPATTNDQVKIDATLTGGFGYDLAIDVDWGAVTALPQTVTDCLKSLGKVIVGQPPKCSIDELMPELKLTFEVDPRLSAEVTASGAASLGFEKSFDVGTIDLPPFPIGPLVFVPSADIVATVSGKASAGFSATAKAHVEIASKAVLSSKSKNTALQPFSVKSADASADTPQVDLYASATAKVGVRLNLALYSVAGPYAMASAVAELDANPLADPCWDIKLAAEAQIGVRVTSPRLPLLGYVTFLDWHADPFRPFEKTVATGSCGSTPEGENPPGGGPNAKALQAPAFKPWAKVLGGPVDGTSVKDVAAFTGAFPFVGPSVDGRWIAGGGGALGVFKVDDRGDGSLTWERQILPDVPYATALRSLASVPSADAGIVTLFRPGDDAAFVVAKQGQSGEYVRVREFDLPSDCVAIPTLLANDRGAGYVVAGYCRNDARIWFAHLDAGLGVIRVRTIADRDPDATRLVPSTMVRVGEDLVVAGDRSRANQAPGEDAQMFVVRLDDEENVSAPVSFACPDRAGLLPMSGAPSLDGSVTLVGDATGLGFVARLKKDNSIGFVTFPRMGTGTRDWFVPSSVAELPTTGLVVGFSSGVLGGAPPAVALLGLDGAGHTQWASEYVLSGAAGPRPFAWPALRITDDGGVLVTAYAGPDAGATEGGALVAMKVFAKDGFLGDGMPVVQNPSTPGEGTYAVLPTPFAPAMGASTATEHAFAYVK